MYEPRSFFIAEALMGAQAQIIADFRIRSHLRAAFASRPIFSRFHQFSADAGFSELGFDEPAFQIPDLIGMTIFNKRSNAGFKKSDQSPAIGFGYQNELRLVMLINVEHFRSMLFIT